MLTTLIPVLIQITINFHLIASSLNIYTLNYNELSLINLAKYVRFVQ